MTKNCMRTTNSAFSGKTIKETGEDKPIFVVLKGFPHPPPPPPPTKPMLGHFFYLSVPRRSSYSFDQPQKDERLS